jgi:hypothetical protein
VHHKFLLQHQIKSNRRYEKQYEQGKAAFKKASSYTETQAWSPAEHQTGQCKRAKRLQSENFTQRILGPYKSYNILLLINCLMYILKYLPMFISYSDNDHYLKSRENKICKQSAPSMISKIYIVNKGNTTLEGVAFNKRRLPCHISQD